MHECRAHVLLRITLCFFSQETSSVARRRQSCKRTKSGKSSLAAQSNKRRQITCHRPAKRSLHACLSCHEASSTSPTMPKTTVLRFRIPCCSAHMTFCRRTACSRHGMVLPSAYPAIGVNWPWPAIQQPFCGSKRLEELEAAPEAAARSSPFLLLLLVLAKALDSPKHLWDRASWPTQDAAGMYLHLCWNDCPLKEVLPCNEARTKG